MSLRAAFEERQSKAPEFRGDARDWYESLPEDDKNFLKEKLMEEDTGWKREVYWQAVGTTGLTASETRFRDLLKWLERSL